MEWSYQPARAGYTIKLQWRPHIFKANSYIYKWQEYTLLFFVQSDISSIHLREPVVLGGFTQLLSTYSKEKHE